MIPVRALLLGSVAIIGGGAQAADLPAKTVAPVEYVRICSTHGTGFFYIPGTETCLRVGGRVRAEYLYVEPTDRSQDAIGFRARGRLNLDARTATAYGMLRTYIRMEITRSSGAYTGGDIVTSTNIAQAFIQFGGLTAGRAVSFFTHPDLPAPNFGDLRFDDPTNAEVDLLAYTFSFGNGFSATLSLENGIERRVNNELDFPLFGVGSPAPIPFDYGGERIPDIVANLRYTGTWGGAGREGVVSTKRRDGQGCYRHGADDPSPPGAGLWGASRLGEPRDEEYDDGAVATRSYFLSNGAGGDGWPGRAACVRGDAEHGWRRAARRDVRAGRRGRLPDARPGGRACGDAPGRRRAAPFRLERL